jgi:hypothetical protein
MSWKETSSSSIGARGCVCGDCVAEELVQDKVWVSRNFIYRDKTCGSGEGMSPLWTEPKSKAALSRLYQILGAVNGALRRDEARPLEVEGGLEKGRKKYFDGIKFGLELGRVRLAVSLLCE